MFVNYIVPILSFNYHGLSFIDNMWILLCKTGVLEGQRHFKITDMAQYRAWQSMTKVFTGKHCIQICWCFCLIIIATKM